jgi:hypothetical protein
VQQKGSPKEPEEKGCGNGERKVCAAEEGRRRKGKSGKKQRQRRSDERSWSTVRRKPYKKPTQVNERGMRKGLQRIILKELGQMTP